MKTWLSPSLLLLAILTGALWNSRAMEANAQRWVSQLQTAQAAAEAEDWEGAVSALAAGYADWSRRQTYLRITASHDAVDEAEAMYHRAAAFARAQEPSEFQAETAGLRRQLRLLAERERLSVKNVF